MERLGEGTSRPSGDNKKTPDISDLIAAAFEATIVLETLIVATEKLEKAKAPEDKVAAGQEYLELLSAAVQGELAGVMAMMNAGVAAVRELLILREQYDGKA